MLLIGIDSGKKTGIAVFDYDKNDFTEFVSTDFWGAIDFFTELRKSKASNSAMVFVEDSRLKSFNWHVKNGANKAVSAKIGRSLGTVDARVELIADGLKRIGYSVKFIHALNTKKKKEYFIERGYRAGANEHIRDAQMCVINNLAYVKKLNE